MSRRNGTATSFADPAADAFRDEVRAWLKESVPAEWRSLSATMDDPQNSQARRSWDRMLADGGYAGLSWPREFGGRGAGPIEEAIFYEECALAGAPEGLGRIGRDLAGPILMQFGNDEQRSKYLPPILDGSEIWCEGLSEPDAGSDLASLKTRATRRDGEYVVTGGKIWTSYAHYSRRSLLLAKTSLDAPRHHNLSLFALDMDQPGVTTTPIRQITGGREFNQVFFDEATVSAADRIGKEGEGWQMIQFGLRSGGGAAHALLKYLELRRIYGQLRECMHETSLRDRGEAEELRISIEVFRWHLLRCVESLASGHPDRGANSIIKLLWSELEQSLTTAGLDAQCDAHEEYWRFAYLRSKSRTIAGGTSEVQRNIIANRVLGLPRG